MFSPKFLLLICALFATGAAQGEGDKLPGKDALRRIGTVRFRHGDGVLSLAYSPDGKILASGARDDPIHLWNAGTGQLLRLLDEHWIWALAFSPDGKYLATGGANKIVRLWNVATGQEITQMKGHKATIKALAFSSDGAVLVSAGEDNTVRLWRVPDGSEEAIYRDHTLGVNAVAVSPDSKHLASGSTDHTVRVWEWALHHVVIHAPAAVTGIAYLPNRKTLITAGDDGFLRVWDIGAARELRQWKGHDGAITHMALSQDGATLATAGQDNTVRIWDVAKGTELTKIARNAGDGDALALTPDGKAVAVAGSNCTIRRLDTATGKPLGDQVLPDGPVTAVICSPDGTLAAAGLATNQVMLFDPASGAEKGRLTCGPGDAEVRLAFSADGKLLATASLLNSIIIWDTAAARETKRFNLPQSEEVRCLAYSPDGLKLAAGCRIGGLRVLDIATGKVHRQLSVPTGVKAVAYGSGGKLLAVASEDDITLYDTDAYQPVRKFTKLNDTVACMAFSPDSRTLAAGMFANAIRLFDLTVPRENPEHNARTLDGHRGVVNSVAWSVNGRCLVSAGFDKTVRVWEFGNGQPISNWPGHAGEVTAVAFHPAGRLVVSGSRDTSLLVWDAIGLGLGGKLSEPPPMDITALNTLWSDLASNNNPRGNHALWTMVSVKDNAKYLAKKVFLTDPKKIKKYFEDLDANSFKTREAAFSALAGYGRWIEKQIRQELAKPCSEEVRQRLGLLLKRFAVQDAISVEQESLRVRRVIEILEQTKTPAAIELLQGLAAGAQEEELREMAHTAVERLMRR